MSDHSDDMEIHSHEAEFHLTHPDRDIPPKDSGRIDTKCNYCSTLEVEWENTPNGWRMFDKGTSNPHRCKSYDRFIERKGQNLNVNHWPKGK